MVPLGDLAKKLEKLITDNSPAILTAIGVTGTLTTAYLTGKATFKAAHLIGWENSYHTERLVLGPPATQRMSTKEKTALVWKFYIPPATTAVVTIAAIICANRIGSRRAAAIAAVYSLTEKAFDEYKQKVVEKLGEKKEQGIRDEIAQDRVDRNPVENREVIVTGNGSVLCQDAFSGRYFLCDMETLKTAENDVNHQIIHDGYSSLSDFYDMIGLPQTSISDEVGWNQDKLLDLKITATLTEGNKKPCIYVDYTVAPARQFNRFE